MMLFSSIFIIYFGGLCFIADVQTAMQVHRNRYRFINTRVGLRPRRWIC
jgi:hypothetical protein